MTKKIYGISSNYGKTKITILDVIDENEWIYTVYDDMNPRHIYPIVKNSSLFTPTIEEAIEKQISLQEKWLRHAKERVERITSDLMDLRDNRQKYIDQANQEKD